MTNGGAATVDAMLAAWADGAAVRMPVHQWTSPKQRARVGWVAAPGPATTGLATGEGALLMPDESVGRARRVLASRMGVPATDVCMWVLPPPATAAGARDEDAGPGAQGSGYCGALAAEQFAASAMRGRAVIREPELARLYRTWRGGAGGTGGADGDARGGAAPMTLEQAVAWVLQREGTTAHVHAPAQVVGARLAQRHGGFECITGASPFAAAPALDGELVTPDGRVRLGHYAVLLDFEAATLEAVTRARGAAFSGADLVVVMSMGSDG